MVLPTFDVRKTLPPLRGINRLLGFGPISEFQPSDTRGYDWIFRDRPLAVSDQPRTAACGPPPPTVAQMTGCQVPRPLTEVCAHQGTRTGTE